MTFVQPLAVFADVMTSSNAFAVNPDYLIGSASNSDPYGIATMELFYDDYAVMPMSSIGTVTNTVNSAGLYVSIRITDGSRSSSIGTFAYKNSANRYDLKYTAPDGYYITRVQPILYRDDLPSPGSYSFSFDYSSHFSYTVSFMSLFSNIHSDNVADQTTSLSLSINEQSGDVYVAPQNFNFNNVEYTAINMAIPETDYVNTLGGSFAINFTRIAAGDYQSTGVDYTSDNYQSDVSGSLSNISSSIGNMSESLDSAAENLEYISTSQNLIIQGIDNVIMHISDQLYAFWDQLYNLIHEPTYARLEQILLALKAIANNSDISAVVDTIEETTQQQITNDNSNTSKVESAVEKHGNFIIEGLKGLFIPSDEYFKSYFDDLYTYFSDRFGFLSFPIDLLVRLVDLFVNSSDKDCILTLPEFEISGEKLITEASFNLTEFLENDFVILLSSIRLVTSIGLIMAFVNLCQDKWNEVMRN